MPFDWARLYKSISVDRNISIRQILIFPKDIDGGNGICYNMINNCKV
ncbi:hypothetical protein CLOSCI_00493 [[Clostridium] scindens ATCC 35704]|nr:hypothetical protein CLOSCI_00493 [[Clostridium] scindens ATCC 35704]